METTLQHPVRIELLATLAHELRNPLAAIQFAVRALEAPNRTSLTVEHARAVIARQVLRIARISEDLLSASYVSTGRLDLRKEAIDLRDIVSAAVETCQPQLDAAHHTLILRLPSQPVVLDIDAVRLTQVLTNLLDNAVKFSAASARSSLASNARTQRSRSTSAITASASRPNFYRRCSTRSSRQIKLERASTPAWVSE